MVYRLKRLSMESNARGSQTRCVTDHRRVEKVIIAEKIARLLLGRTRCLLLACADKAIRIFFWAADHDRNPDHRTQRRGTALAPRRRAIGSKPNCQVPRPRLRRGQIGVRWFDWVGRMFDSGKPDHQRKRGVLCPLGAVFARCATTEPSVAHR